MRHAALNEQILQRELVQDHVVRLNREHQPPTRRTKVFEWTHSDDPSDDHLYRQPVSSKSFEDVFESYHASQKCYDFFCNEWGLCEEFDPSSGGGYDSDDNFSDDIFQKPGPGDIQVEGPIPSARLASPVRFTESSNPWRPLFPILNNPIKSPSLHYGFIHPLMPSRPLPAHFTNTRKKSWIEILCLAGLSIVTEKKFPVEAFFDQNLIAFFDALDAGQWPPKDQWDLDQDNCHAIIFSDELQNILVGPSSGYVILFSNPLFSWILWVSSAADALHIYRVQQELQNQYDVAKYLVENGFRFHTLLVWKASYLLCQYCQIFL